MCLIIVGFVALLLFFTTRSEAKSKYYEDLYKYVPEEKRLDPNVSRTKAIKKILSQPGVREAAEKMKEERARNRAKNEDLDRKRDIERRVYSYKYEELIYPLCRICNPAAFSIRIYNPLSLFRFPHYKCSYL